MSPKWERKRSLTFFSFLLPQLKYLGLAAEPLELHRKDSNRAQKRGKVSHMVPSALSNLNFPRAHHIPCMLCIQVSDACFEDLLKAKDRVPSNLQLRSEKLANCMTCSFPATSHFTVLLYISTPKTTEIIIFTTPDFWNNLSGDFLIFNSLQRFPKTTLKTAFCKFFESTT